MPDKEFLVGPKTKIYGTVDADQDVLVSGYIDGALICRRAKIAPGGTVLGDVVAESCIVEGVVDGSIYADRLSLISNCQVFGDIHHRDLDLQAGSYFEGKSRHSKKPRSLAPVQALPVDDQALR